MKCALCQHGKTGFICKVCWYANGFEELAQEDAQIREMAKRPSQNAFANRRNVVIMPPRLGNGNGRS